MEVCGGDGYSGGLWGPSWLGKEAGGGERGEGLRADLAAGVVGPVGIREASACRRVTRE